ncbi:ATP binding protein [Aureococcus anophagefferens]|nr:ATP binding protein [Aureococcus anophagefferens]
MSDSSDGEEDAPPKDFAALFGRAPSANSTCTCSLIPACSSPRQRETGRAPTRALLRCAGAGEFFAAAVEEPARAGGAAPAGLALNPGASPDGARFLDGDLSRHLKPHQERGVRFMWERCVGPAEEGDARGCVLADHMGLGKTLQLICVLKSWLGGGPPRRTALVIAPAFVLSNWLGEIERWLPRDRALRPGTLPGRAARRRASRPSPPFVERPIVDYLEGAAGDAGADGDGNHDGATALRRAYVLQRELEDVVLRRGTDELGDDLPPRTDWVVECALSPVQRALYDAFEQSAGLFTAEAGLGRGHGAQRRARRVPYALAIVNHPDIVHGALAEEERLFDDGGDDDGAADALGRFRRQRRARRPEATGWRAEVVAREASRAAAQKARDDARREQAKKFRQQAFDDSGLRRVERPAVARSWARPCWARAVLERLIDASNAAADSGAKLRYARIDGATPAAQRSAIVDDFNAARPPGGGASRGRREEATAAPPAGLRARREEAAAAAAGARGDAAASGRPPPAAATAATCCSCPSRPAARAST